MVELILVASILVSMNYTIMQALMLASMFLPVLLAMKYFLPQVKWERTHKEITGIVCLFFALRGLIMYEKLPAKPEVVEATGKKPLLK